MLRPPADRRGRRHHPERRERRLGARSAPARRACRRPRRSPRLRGRWRPPHAPSARHAASAKLPLQAPAERSACAAACRARSRRARRRSAACRRTAQYRCTAGFQPPETASEIAVDLVARPGDAPCRRCRAHRPRRARPRCAPWTSATTALSMSTSMPAAHALRAPARRVAGAQIDDGGDRDAGVEQVERGAIGAVVVGEDDGALARRDAVAVDVGATRPRPA